MPYTCLPVLIVTQYTVHTVLPKICSQERFRDCEQDSSEIIEEIALPVSDMQYLFCNHLQCIGTVQCTGTLQYSADILTVLYGTQATNQCPEKGKVLNYVTISEKCCTVCETMYCTAVLP